MYFRSLFVSLLLLTRLPVAVDAQVATPPRQLNTQPIASDSVRQRPPQHPTAPMPANTTRFAVGLKNGQVFRAYDVEIKQPLFSHSFLLLDGGQRFDLDQVRYYEDETGFYVRTTLPRSNRETTLRRDRVGRLSMYSITSTQYSGGSPFGYGPYGYSRYGGFGYPYGYGGSGYRTVKTQYFSKDNGPIEDLNLRNLSIATADNPASRALLDDARKYQRYTTLSYVAAGGLLVAGLLTSFQQSQGGPSISPLVYAGLPLLVVPLVLQGREQRNIKQAVALYNRAQ